MVDSGSTRDLALKEFEALQRIIERQENLRFKVETLAPTFISAFATAHLSGAIQLSGSAFLLLSTFCCITFWLLGSIYRVSECRAIKRAAEIEKFLRRENEFYDGPRIGLTMRLGAISSPKEIFQTGQTSRAYLLYVLLFCFSCIVLLLGRATAKNRVGDTMRPIKIVSGGQSGADRAALDAAIALGIEHGGWCPKGRIAEDGQISGRYHLQEHPSDIYSHRTEANVVDSDATLLFTLGELSGGTANTASYAIAHSKPFRVVELKGRERSEVSEEILDWLLKQSSMLNASKPLFTLNVAGPRESKAPGIHDTILRVLGDVLTQFSARANASGK